MKDNTATIMIRRGKKDIVIHIKAGEWHKLPSLDFIEDVEIHATLKSSEDLKAASSILASSQQSLLELSR